jgi:hypothetical protein
MYSLIPILLFSQRVVAFHWAIPQKPTVPTAGHASATIDGKVYAFGGLVLDGATSQVRVFDVDYGWDEFTTRSDPPPKRMYAAGAAYADELMICGGWDPGDQGSGGTFYDDVWALNVTSGVWRKLDFVLPGGSVSRHTATSIGGSKIVVHAFRCKDYLIVLDMEKNLLEVQPTTGPSPHGLSMMSATFHPKENVIVFSGGSSKVQKMWGGVYVLDVTTWTWSKLDVSNAPVPTASSSSVALPSTPTGMRQLVFGGASIPEGGYPGLKSSNDLWRLDVSMEDSRCEWTRVVTTGFVPPERVASQMDVLGKNHVLVHGGWKPETKMTHGLSHILELYPDLLEERV